MSVLSFKKSVMSVLSFKKYDDVIVVRKSCS